MQHTEGGANFDPEVYIKADQMIHEAHTCKQCSLIVSDSIAVSGSGPEFLPDFLQRQNLLWKCKQICHHIQPLPPVACAVMFYYNNRNPIKDT